jgi:hypothetical protein
MKIYNYNPENGYFVGESLADESPLEKEVFLIPANATEIPAPKFESGEIAVFDGKKWSVEKLPIIEKAVEPTSEEIAKKAAAKAALLERLGITEEEAKLLLS